MASIDPVIQIEKYLVYLYFCFVVSLNIFYLIIRNGIGQKLYNIMLVLSCLFVCFIYVEYAKPQMQVMLLQCLKYINSDISLHDIYPGIFFWNKYDIVISGTGKFSNNLSDLDFSLSVFKVLHKKITSLTKEGTCPWHQAVGFVSPWWFLSKKSVKIFGFYFLDICHKIKTLWWTFTVSWLLFTCCVLLMTCVSL